MEWWVLNVSYRKDLRDYKPSGCSGGGRGRRRRGRFCFLSVESALCLTRNRRRGEPPTAAVHYAGRRICQCAREFGLERHSRVPVEPVAVPWRRVAGAMSKVWANDHEGFQGEGRDVLGKPSKLWD